MQPRLPHIASLTADYDAIELAIRETSRGRWFLATYLERNRSAETRMLLSAIGKLERSMRDAGHMAETLAPMETLARLREEIMRGREDIAKSRKREGSPAWLPVPRFTFDSLTGELADETRAIRAAAANLQTAASALRTAGLFPGVVQQIGERIEDITAACNTQEAAMRGIGRMATLLSELEAEIIGALDGPDSEDILPENFEATGCELHPFGGAPDAQPPGDCNISIPDNVMRELSAALVDCLDDEDEEPFPGLP